MTDKVQKIREWIERKLEVMQYQIHRKDTYKELKSVLNYMDSLQEEPVSKPNEELAETYLAVFDKKFPILPTLKGKQLADYKNFLNKCQQIFGLKEWGIRPIQSKLFEKLTLLWAAWGAEHLQGVGRQDEKEQDIPVSEELEEAAEEWDESLYRSDAFKAGAKWQKEQMMAKAIDATVSFGKSLTIPWLGYILDKMNLKHGNKLKVILIKEN